MSVGFPLTSHRTLPEFLALHGFNECGYHEPPRLKTHRVVEVKVATANDYLWGAMYGRGKVGELLRCHSPRSMRAAPVAYSKATDRIRRARHDFGPALPVSVGEH